MIRRHARTPYWRAAGSQRVALTLIDQVISSTSNSLLAVLIARAGGADALGTFGVAFLVWLAVLGTNRAAVTEPMTVTGGVDTRLARFPDGLLASLVLGVAVAVLLGTVGLVLELAGIKAVALLALAPCIPSLLVQDYCRAMAFRQQRPDHAVLSDTGFAVAQGATSVALLLLGATSTAAFIGAWGFGAMVGAAIGIGLNRMHPRILDGIAQLRALWPLSRWFLAEFGTAFPADQGYLLLLPILLGTSQFGLYRAGVGLVGPVVVVLVAGGNIGLPEAVRRLRQHGMPGLSAYAARLNAAVVAVTVVYCAVVAVFAEPVLRLVYGEEFVGAIVITRLIAAQYVLLALSFGFGQAVKAAGLMRLLWATRAVSTVVSITAVTVFAQALGLIGAGFASVTAACAYSVGVASAYRRMRRLHATGRIEDEPGWLAACASAGLAVATPDRRAVRHPAKGDSNTAPLPNGTDRAAGASLSACSPEPETDPPGIA